MTQTTPPSPSTQGAHQGQTYDPSFYTGHVAGSIGSASQVVPLALSLLKPASVLDVGCGTGTWLTVFQRLGITDIQGLDGPYVKPENLHIPPANFQSRDLTKPFNLNRKFDLAVSVEVAEHLPDSSADGFVASLCAHADAVLFSAAIPGQGGTYHVNEQWQHYWVAKFAAQGYVVVDYFRPRIWRNPDVEAYYCQNILLFVKPALLQSNPELAAARQATNEALISLVHPSMYLLKDSTDTMTFKILIPLLFRQISKSIRFRLQRLTNKRSGDGYVVRARF